SPFFFSSRRRHTRWPRDWSSDVCSSDLYAQMHIAGPKRNFDWRLETPERAYAAGFRRLGIGALYGLADWRLEAISAAAHADYLRSEERRVGKEGKSGWVRREERRDEI